VKRQGPKEENNKKKKRRKKRKDVKAVGITIRKKKRPHRVFEN